MGLFSSDPPDSARWSTSVHEAAHVVLARAAGGRARAWLDEDGRTGGFEADMPATVSPVDVAIVHLAGGAAQQLILGRDGPSDDDLDNARDELRGTTFTLRRARRAARYAVTHHRNAIKRAARILHRDGRI